MLRVLFALLGIGAVVVALPGLLAAYAAVMIPVSGAMNNIGGSAVSAAPIMGLWVLVLPAALIAMLAAAMVFRPEPVYTYGREW